LFLNDVSQGTSTGSTTADSFTIDRIGIGRSTTDWFDGTIKYFKVFESDGSVLLDIRSRDEKQVDISGNQVLTTTGTFTYSLSKTRNFTTYTPLRLMKNLTNGNLGR